MHVLEYMVSSEHETKGNAVEEEDQKEEEEKKSQLPQCARNALKHHAHVYLVRDLYRKR